MPAGEACLDNAAARRLFLAHHALSDPPAGPGRGADLAGLIHRLGFVQLDSVRTVERAHHMILFARRPAYRPANLDRLYATKTALFEHWTHDAAVLPLAFYRHWQMRFRRDRARMSARWSPARAEEMAQKSAEVLAHIGAHGACGSGDVGAQETRGTSGWWDWHPSKAALDFLWRSGELAVQRREGFRKIYDLSARVIPPEIRSDIPDEADSRDWLCRSALDRLGFATPGEIAAFWDTLRPHEAKAWVEAALKRGEVAPVEITCVDGTRRRAVRWAGPDPGLPEPPKRMRVLSPFDPALRDRRRAERLFGFRYRIEIFVPAAQRVYGYYVFPLLEGARLVGRIDMTAHRGDGVLDITALWPEPGVRWGAGRQARLEAELTRLARFAGLDALRWGANWLRDGG